LQNPTAKINRVNRCTRVSIPKPIQERLKVRVGDILEFVSTEETVIIRRKM